jgi:hypothetical protein
MIESLKGQCGDDEVAFSAKAMIAVVPTSAVFEVARSERLPASEMRLEPAGLAARAPPTPPPRPSSARART